jgi:hypothetical protein
LQLVPEGQYPSVQQTLPVGMQPVPQHSPESQEKDPQHVAPAAAQPEPQQVWPDSQ